jgi:MoxR-like ATPase
MLPEADIAFLDEVFLGSTAILNTLLGVLNERRFRRGHTQLDCPLRLCVGAANGLPDDEALAAFGDRFLLHVFIDPVPDHQLEAMLAGGWQSDHRAQQTLHSMADLDTLSVQLKDVKLDAVRPALVKALRQLRKAGIQLSDRRIVKAQGLLAAAALLSGRLEASEADLWPLLYVLPTQESQHNAREVLKEILVHSTNVNLMSAVEEATQQPMSRLTRLVDAAQSALSTLIGIEAVLREIDANFSAETLPAELGTLRTQLVASLSDTQAA